MSAPGDTLLCRESGQVVARHVLRATGFFDRLRGLLGRPSLDPDVGLWIEPCDGVHTFFMRFPIDVAVLDARGRVLRCIDSLPPWRATRLHADARTCVELAAGTLVRTSVEPGMQLLLVREASRERSS